MLFFKFIQTLCLLYLLPITSLAVDKSQKSTETINSIGCELALVQSQSPNKLVETLDVGNTFNPDDLRGTLRPPHSNSLLTMLKETDQNGIDRIFPSEKSTSAREQYSPLRIHKKAAQLFIRSQHQTNGSINGLAHVDDKEIQTKADIREHFLLRNVTFDNKSITLPDIYYLRSFWFEKIENERIFNDFIKVFVERNVDGYKLSETLAIRFQLSMATRDKYSRGHVEEPQAIDQTVELPNVSIYSVVRKIEIPNPRDPNGFFMVYVQTGTNMIRVFRIRTRDLAALEGAKNDKNHEDLFAAQIENEIASEQMILSVEDFDGK